MQDSFWYENHESLFLYTCLSYALEKIQIVKYDPGIMTLHFRRIYLIWERNTSSKPNHNPTEGDLDCTNIELHLALQTLNQTNSLIYPENI